MRSSAWALGLDDAPVKLEPDTSGVTAVRTEPQIPSEGATHAELEAEQPSARSRPGSHTSREIQQQREVAARQQREIETQQAREHDARGDAGHGGASGGARGFAAAPAHVEDEVRPSRVPWPSASSSRWRSSSPGRVTPIGRALTPRSTRRCRGRRATPSRRSVRRRWEPSCTGRRRTRISSTPSASTSPTRRVRRAPATPCWRPANRRCTSAPFRRPDQGVMNLDIDSYVQDKEVRYDHLGPGGESGHWSITKPGSVKPFAQGRWAIEPGKDPNQYTYEFTFRSHIRGYGVATSRQDAADVLTDRLRHIATAHQTEEVVFDAKQSF